MLFSHLHRAECSADTPLGHDQIVADCAKILLIGTDGKQALVEALKYLRQAFGVGRAAVFENHRDNINDLPCFRCVHEANDPSIKSAENGNMLSTGAYSGALERWTRLLNSGQSVVGSARSLPAGEFELLARFGIRSVLVLSIRVQGRWHGFMTLEDYQSERAWNPAEVELMRTTAEMVGAQIARIKTEEELRHSGSQMRELLRRERHATMQLEAAMNQLLAQQEELRVFNKELREARAAAEGASQAKSEFLSNMSHEIRTPLTAILGWAEVLGATALESGWAEDSVQAVCTIQRNGEHLLEVINGILDLSKIEAGKFQLELSRCSPRAVVEEVAALMQVRAKAKGLLLETAYDPPMPAMIRTDPTRLRQVLINLVGNAIKFTETGYVRVATRLMKESGGEPAIQFDVIDTGIGMNTEQMSRLFHAFTQVDNSTTRPYQGTGLGLAISKRLTELMGGRIVVESAPGRGSTFRVTIATGLINEFEPEIPPAARSGARLPATEAILSAATDEPLHARILLAEDGPDNQRLIAFLLQKAGAEVVVAGNGRRAVAKVLEAMHAGAPFDVVLMDMQMPEMDGYAATQMLRREGIDVPIVALTAHAMSGDREKCIAAGCNEYLTKPISRSKLIAVICKEMARPHRIRSSADGDD